MVKEPQQGVNNMKCFSCGKKMKVGYRWYHADQDDLICKDCARGTRHTDTAYSGMYVINTSDPESEVR